MSSIPGDWEVTFPVVYPRRRIAPWWRKAWVPSFSDIVHFTGNLRYKSSGGHLTYKSSGGHLVYCPACTPTTYCNPSGPLPESFTGVIQNVTLCTCSLVGGTYITSHFDINGSHTFTCPVGSVGLQRAWGNGPTGTDQGTTVGTRWTNSSCNVVNSSTQFLHKNLTRYSATEWGATIGWSTVYLFDSFEGSQDPDCAEDFTLTNQLLACGDAAVTALGARAGGYDGTINFTAN
jgi:hypothetical protein